MTVPVTGTIPGPFRPERPGWPQPQRQPQPPLPGPPEAPVAPVQVWLDPGPWSARLYERLLAQRIVMAQGQLNDEAATRLCAQLLTLDAEAAEPIRLELQGLDAELPAALTVIGVLETLRAPVVASVAGRLTGAALGVLAACGQRRAYPNAVLELSEPRLCYRGPVTAVTAREEQARVMVDALWERIAQTTGREIDEIRADARRRRFFTVAQAIGFGLVSERAAAH
jgi:ATP-dependent Clp protease protease subunit